MSKYMTIWRGAGFIFAVGATLMLVNTRPKAGSSDDPEWVAVATSAGKMKCDKDGTRFTMRVDENGSISGRWGRSYSGSWRVDNGGTGWCRSINSGSEECQPVSLNDDGSITFGPSTCRPK